MMEKALNGLSKGLFEVAESRKYAIDSLMDIDFYKFTMGQLIYHKHPDVPVRFSFTNRTKKVHLGDYISEGDLMRELDHAKTLRFNNSDLHYLRGTNEYDERMFKEDYLGFLAGLRLPPYKLELADANDGSGGRNIKLDFEGKWSEVTYWETIALSIVNELYFKSQMDQMSDFQRDNVYATGIQRLNEKIKVLKTRPDITFSDFGTRRRFSGKWQDYVVKNLAKEMSPKQLLGTSNTYLAMKHGLLPMGTCAHEMEMGMSGIMHGSDEDIRSVPAKLRQDWRGEYGKPLSIYLSDTFGSDFFFRTCDSATAGEWKGLRQDSGSPISFTDKAIEFYRSRGVDPREKMIVYSDGLEVSSIIEVADYRKEEIKKTFGWGTNLTNDLGLPPVSIVVKLMESNGHGTVKLSDNIAKALGKQEDVERFKRIFGYTETMNREVKY